MKYKVDRRDDIVIIELLGSLEGGWETFQLKDEVAGRVKEGVSRFLIDLHRASFVNSTGIGVMVAMQITVTRAEGRIKFCGIGDRVRRSLQATGAGIWESMEIYEDQEQALKSFED